MLGFSVFLNNIDATYMHNMTDAGFSDVFTSLQLPDVTEAHLAQLGKLCAVNHLRLTVDIHLITTLLFANPENKVLVLISNSGEKT